MSKYTTGLKTLLQESLFKPKFYGNLVYRFRKIIDKTDFSVQCKKIVTHNKKIGYNMDILRQTVCMVVNPIMTDSCASLFNCTMIGPSSD